MYGRRRRRREVYITDSEESDGDWAPAPVASTSSRPVRGIVAAARDRANAAATSRINKKLARIKPWHPTHSASDLPADVIREIAAILVDVDPKAGRAFAYSCRAIDEASASALFEVFRPAQWTLPVRRRRAREQADEERLDTVELYVLNVLPRRREHLRYLWVDSQSERREHFVEIIKAAMHLRFISITVSPGSVTGSLESALRGSPSIEALNVSVNRWGSAYGYHYGAQPKPVSPDVARLVACLPNLAELKLSMANDAPDSALSTAVFNLPSLRQLELEATTLCVAAGVPASPVTALEYNARPDFGQAAASISDEVLQAMMSLETLSCVCMPNGPLFSLPHLTALHDRGIQTSVARFTNSPLTYIEIQRPVRFSYLDHATAASNTNVETVKALLTKGEFSQLRELSVKTDTRRADISREPWVEQFFDVCSGRGVALFINDFAIEAD